MLVLAMFLCVLAHEYGHALAARRYGIPTPSITLLPIGGVARLARAPSGPGEEIVVAAAGPLVNVAIALALAAVLGFDIDPAADFWSPRHGFVERLAAINVFLVAFNLIPAYPMDGGRILRGLLTYVLGRARATSVASVIGRAFAGIFGLVGVVTANPFLILIAILNLAGLRRRKRRAVRSK